MLRRWHTNVNHYLHVCPPPWKPQGCHLNISVDILHVEVELMARFIWLKEWFWITQNLHHSSHLSQFITATMSNDKIERTWETYYKSLQLVHVVQWYWPFLNFFTCSYVFHSVHWNYVSFSAQVYLNEKYTQNTPCPHLRLSFIPLNKNLSFLGPIIEEKMSRWRYWLKTFEALVACLVAFIHPLWKYYVLKDFILFTKA